MNPQIPDRSSSATIQHLAVAWREAKVLLPLFPLMAKGEPLEIDRASQATGVPAQDEADNLYRAIWTAVHSRST